MRWNSILLTMCLVCGFAAAAAGQDPETPAPAPAPAVFDPIRAMVERLDLEKYKATIKGLTAFGDRRQGTERNRKAVDWIEAQLKSYGCTNTERIVYTHPSPEASDPATAGRGRGAGQRGRGGRGGSPVSTGPVRGREGGPTQFGTLVRTPVYTPDAPGAAPLDPRLRALNAEPTTPGERQEVYCTKIGATTPGEMYIVGAHMDGIGWGEAANDDGSGTAIVMELARIFSAPDVQTDRSIRFILWNNEESGLNGAWAYVNQRKDRQGKEDPPGSGRYPEPKWVGMIQHDMMMWDHGMPGPDGKVSPEQRREADVNIEFQTRRENGGGRARARVGLQDRQRSVCDRLPGERGAAHDEHGFGPVHESGARDQPARERARRADRRRMGSQLAPAERRVHDVHRQGLPAGVERGPDDAGRGGTAGRSDAQESAVNELEYVH